MRLLPEYRTRALRAGLEPFAREDHPGVHPFLKERPHGGQELFVREDARLRVLVGLEDAHVPDRSRPPGGRGRAELLLLLPPSVGLLSGSTGKSGQLEQRANLDLAFLEGDALGPFDGFLLDFAWISQKPAISSFVSANGPSMTLNFPLDTGRAHPWSSPGARRPRAARRP